MNSNWRIKILILIFRNRKQRPDRAAKHRRMQDPKPRSLNTEERRSYSMEALTPEITRMLNDMKSMTEWQNAHPLDSDGEDILGFKFEPLNAFSTEPLTFTETAMKLHAEARKVYKMARMLNRHSPIFIQTSAQLEKLVYQLGSACITKAVMEQRGENSMVMDNMLFTLTIDNLRRMTAFNFRKCYDSYMESQTNYRMNPAALNLSMRWAALDRRLLSTQEKIEQIKSGKIKVDGDDFSSPGSEAEGTLPPDASANGDVTPDLSPEPEGTVTLTENGDAKFSPLSAKGRALPVNKAIIRDSGNQSADTLRAESTGTEKNPTADNASAGGGFHRGKNTDLEGTLTRAEADPSGDTHQKPIPEPERAVIPASSDQAAAAVGDPGNPIPSASVTAEPVRTDPGTPSADTSPYDDIDDEYDENDCYDEDPDTLPYSPEDLVKLMEALRKKHHSLYEYTGGT